MTDKERQGREGRKNGKERRGGGRKRGRSELRCLLMCANGACLSCRLVGRLVGESNQADRRSEDWLLALLLLSARSLRVAAARACVGLYACASVPPLRFDSL